MDHVEAYKLWQWGCPHCSFINVIDADNGEHEEVCDGCNREAIVHVD